MKLSEFDFRVWDKHHKDCGNKDCKCQTKYVYGEEAKTRLSEFKEDCEIELFTGFYDKKGNKIYEGDIICCYTSQGKPLYYFITTNENINTFQIFVISDLEKFKICNEIDINNFLYCDLSNLEDMKFNIEVVGNIHNRESISKGLK
ncbi:hypothetical protein H6Y32_001607 [Campylobacter coli]|nr:hypothetical protein [Campylobacter coli]